MPCASDGGPTWLQKVSFIIDYAYDTCSTPWRVYLRTGGRALGNLAMTMLFIDAGDLARSFFRPKNSRGFRHSAPFLGRGKARVSKGLFPEPSDLIADTTRAITETKRPVYSDGWNHVWHVDTHLQKVLNKVVFTNMATDFGYDWFSGIVNAPDSYCDRGRFSCLYTVLPSDSPHFVGIVKENPVDYQHEAFCGLNQIVLPEGLWLCEALWQSWPEPPKEGEPFVMMGFVGDTENLKPCGRPGEKTFPDGPEIVDNRVLSVVKGPDFWRVLTLYPAASEANPYGFQFVRLRGFRLR